MNNNGFPYRVGYGLCNNDFTITEMSIAAFEFLEDAKAYVTFKYDNFMLHDRIYYIDEQDAQSMQKIRYIYDSNQQKFFDGNELVSDKRDIYISGYEVSAEYEEDEDDYNRESNVCMSYQSAELNKQEFFRFGATTVEILDRDDIGIKKYFWGADKFLRGNADIERVEKIINDIRNTPCKPGESIYQRIGTGLEKVSTEEMIRYFEKNIIGGAGLIRDYIETQIINNEINRFRSREYDNAEIERQ